MATTKKTVATTDVETVEVAVEGTTEIVGAEPEKVGVLDYVKAATDKIPKPVKTVVETAVGFVAGVGVTLWVLAKSGGSDDSESDDDLKTESVDVTEF